MTETDRSGTFRRRTARFRPRTPLRPRSPWGRYQEPCAPALRPKPRLDPRFCARADWPEFWNAAQRQLRSVGLRTSTLRVYRHVLRSFRHFLRNRGGGHGLAPCEATRPGCATPQLAREFLYRLADRHASWSWTATHITALRTVFDKLGGAALTEGIPTPKRPRRLHDVLDPAEVTHLLKAAGSTRDRLAILLLYGCGLKTSELCALRWSDVDLDGRTLRVQCAGGTPCSMRCASLQGTREREPRGAERSTRQVFLPENAIPLLQAESCLRDASDPVFPGVSGRSPTKPDLFGRSTTQPETQSGRPFCARTLQRIVRHAAAKAGLTKEVCCRTLRRSYAVQCLRDGMNVRQLQESLGHQHVETTLQYCRYLPPKAANNSDALFCEFRLQPLEPSPFAPALAAIQCSAP